MSLSDIDLWLLLISFDFRLDTVNNVEAVFIQDPVKGKYRIEVVGANVVGQVQDFALVYSGEIS